MLTGTIPHDVGKLARLQFLDLGGKPLVTGTVPEEITPMIQFTNLIYVAQSCYRYCQKACHVCVS